MSGILQVFFVFFSGILHTCGIPNEFLLKAAPFGIPSFGLVALIPFYIALSHAHSYKHAFLLTGFQALTVHVCSSFWLANFKDFAIFTLGASGLGTAFIASVFGWFLYIPYSTIAHKSEWIRIPAFRIIYFASVWTVWEWTKSTGFLAYPWGTLSMTAYPLHIITQIVDITGTYGITFLFAFFAAICGEGIALFTTPSHRVIYGFSSYIRAFMFFVVLVLLTILYGTYQYRKPRTPKQQLNTIIVQQNLDPWIANSSTQTILSSEDETLKAMQSAQAQHTSTDLVVWSEAVLNRPFPWAVNYYQGNPREYPLLSFIRDCNTPFVIGAPYTFSKAQGLYGNAAILIQKDGSYADAYNKIHLVPFAEAIPGMEYEWVRNLMNLAVGFSSGWKAGNQIKVFDIPSKEDPNVITKISTPICFEDAFPPICAQLHKAGSDVFMNITDDSWSLTASAEYQHFVIAAFRAIEFRTTMVRSTNSGYSAVINPVGSIIDDLPIFTQTAKHCNVPIYSHTTTTYERFGNFFVALCALIIVISCFIIRKKQSE